MLKLTPEGLRGQRGQLLPILGLEQAFDFRAGLGNAVFARARGVLQPLLAVLLHQALEAQLQFQVRLEQVERDGFIAHGKTPYWVECPLGRSNDQAIWPIVLRKRANDVHTSMPFLAG